MKILSQFFCILILSLVTVSFSETIEIPLKKVDGCYQISTADDLFSFAQIVNGYYDQDFVRHQESSACGVLTADISIAQRTWIPFKEFSGIFDGRGHTIFGFVSDSVRCFFKSVSGTKENPAIIKNVGWINGSLNTTENGDVGLIDNATGYVEIDHVFNEMNFSAGSGNASCFVINQYGRLKISNSYNKGRITHDRALAGIFVTTSRGVVSLENVYNLGGSAPLVGYAMDTLFIANAFTLGSGVTFDCAVGRRDYQGRYSVIETNNLFSAKRCSFGDSASAEEFLDGSVAIRLHYRNNGGIWGQSVGVDEYPNFSGEIINDYSSTVKVSNLQYVTFDGDSTSYPDYYVEGYEIKVAVEPPQRDGFVFTGWFNNPDGAGNPLDTLSDIETGDQTIYGKWWPIPTKTGKCYEIASMDDLFGFAAVVNGALGVEKDSTACAKLVTDIRSVSGERLWWLPIQNFAGSFDGNGFTIADLYAYDKAYYERESKPLGLFGSVAGGSEENPVVIKNLKMENCFFYGSWSVGGIIGFVDKESNVYLDSIVVDNKVFSEQRAGGFIGSIYSSATVSINNSTRTNKTEGNYNIGGLVGDVRDYSKLSIENCSVEGAVIAQNSGAGAFIGVASKSEVLIRRTYVEGEVRGDSYVGGFVGHNIGTLRIENSYHVGDVNGDDCIYGAGSYRGVVIGGFIGVASGDISIVNSFQYGNLENTCSESRTGAFAGVLDAENLNVTNLFYPSSLPQDSIGNAVDADLFINGNIAKELHDYNDGSINGDIWGQKVGVDLHPVFTSNVVGYGSSDRYSKYVLHWNGSKEEGLYKVGSITELPVFKDDAYTLYGWFTDEEFTGDTTLHIDETASGELHYYGYLSWKSFNVSFVIDNRDGCSGSVVEDNFWEGTDFFFIYGYNAKLKAIPSIGCKADESSGIFKDNKAVIENITEDVELHVSFVKDIYKITYHSTQNDMSYLSSEDLEFTYWDEVTLATPTSDCYTFGGWYGNPAFRGQSFDKIEKGSIGNKEFWAKWTLKDEQRCLPESSSSEGSSSSVESSSSAESSSSSQDVVLAMNAKVLSPFSVEVLGRKINLTGVRPGTSVTLMDSQGRIILSRMAAKNSIVFEIPFSGRFVVHANGTSALVSIR